MFFFSKELGYLQLENLHQTAQLKLYGLALLEIYSSLFFIRVVTLSDAELQFFGRGMEHLKF